MIVPSVVTWLQLQLNYVNAGVCSHTEDRICCVVARQHAVQAGEELGPSSDA